MLRSRLFWKLFLILAVVNLAASSVLLLLTLDWWEGRAYEQAEAQLQSAAALLRNPAAEWLARQPSEELQQELVQLGERSGFRLTLIDARGVVLADSSQPDLAAVQEMENHAGRPEVREAMQSGEGVHRRNSATISEPYLYLAQRVRSDQQARGVVRVAVPILQLEQQLGELRNRLWLFALLLVTVLLVVTYVLVRSIVRPVLELSAAANAISRGEYTQRAYVASNDELGQLARSFNRMSEDLDAQFTELRSSGQRQATVLGGMIEGVVAINQQQRILLANQAAGDLFGFDPATIEGRPLIEVIRNHTLTEGVHQSLLTGDPRRLDIQLQGASPKSLAVQVTPLPGRPNQGAVIVIHDTTELRRLETLRQEFVANVSHELKTPLSSIKAYAETLANGALEDEHNALNFVRRIEEQADRLNALILDLLSLARIESEEETFELQSVVVGEAVAACQDDNAAQAEAKQINLVAEADAPEITVQADPEGLLVILNNLVDNALKYTPEGGNVTIRWREAPQGRVRIEVADNGIGIPKDELPRVFERFHRVDRARSRELGGTGLGLSIVKHLCNAFGGTVAVESTQGSGSVFAVVLMRG
ncbi:MAG: HAMP domain-containing protein [Planctomycetales bacterium]|nr:HAMP domain-containing protein [Planctomycetales bacterium]